MSAERGAILVFCFTMFNGIIAMLFLLGYFMYYVHLRHCSTGTGEVNARAQSPFQIVESLFDNAQRTDDL
jgi:hypothetical protein